MLRREKERHFTPWTRSLRLISADDMIHYTGLPHGCRCFPLFTYHLLSSLAPRLPPSVVSRSPFRFCGSFRAVPCRAVDRRQCASRQRCALFPIRERGKEEKCGRNRGLSFFSPFCLRVTQYAVSGCEEMVRCVVKGVQFYYTLHTCVRVACRLNESSTRRWVRALQKGQQHALQGCGEVVARPQMPAVNVNNKR